MSQNPKVVIGVIGHTGSGKDTFCDILEDWTESYGYSLTTLYTGTAGLLGDLSVHLSPAGFQKDTPNMILLAATLREFFGEDVIARGMAKRVCESKAQVVLY